MTSIWPVATAPGSDVESFLGRPRGGCEGVITHPEKVLFPDEGITKGELASYYARVAPVMLPHIRRRPVTMERYHGGIGAPGFFQKDVSKGFPAWLKRVEVPKNEGSVNHPIVTDTRSLLWLANQNSITIHVWPSRAPNFYPCLRPLHLGGSTTRRGIAENFHHSQHGPTRRKRRRPLVRPAKNQTLAALADGTVA